MKSDIFPQIIVTAVVGAIVYEVYKMLSTQSSPLGVPLTPVNPQSVIDVSQQANSPLYGPTMGASLLSGIDNPTPTSAFGQGF
jgi:hypothetical protein